MVDLMPKTVADLDTTSAVLDSVLADVIQRLEKMSDDAYCAYSRQLNQRECLGWAAKVETQTFGEAELKAHCAAAEMLGRHRALHEAAAMLLGVVRNLQAGVKNDTQNDGSEARRKK